MAEPIAEMRWSTAELPALIDALARLHGIPRADAMAASVPTDKAQVRVWMENWCARLSIEVEGVDLWGFRIEEKLRGAAPAVVPVADGWIGFVSLHGRTVTVITPALRRRKVALEDLRLAVASGIEAPYRQEVDALLEQCGVAPARRERAARALLAERSRYDRAGTMYQLRLPPGAGFGLQLRQTGLLKRLGLLAASHLVEYSLWIGAWYLLGRDALAGRMDNGWLTGWTLALATLVPFRMITTWCQGVLAIGGGGLLRQRLLDGALKLAPEEVRHEGAGRFLARSIEAEMVETLALSGGLMSALALIEIVLAMAVLAAGAGGGWHALLLGAWTGLGIWAAVRYWQARRRWTDTRLALTHDLVERMTGHRTRVAQQPSSEWHREEDRQAEEYATRSRQMDNSSARLNSLIPAGWVLAGIAGLAPAFLSNDATTASLAVSVGGVLLAWKALKRFVTGVGNLGGAAISWTQIRSLFHAAGRPVAAGLVSAAPAAPDVVLAVKDVTFVREPVGRLVLDGVNLELRRGDRVLVEGESGGGKSTLVSLVAGLREPSGGLLLSGGLDRRTLGDALWRRAVVAAPQYHENHVLTGTFAYNLLMGQNWPALPDEMKEAQAVCVELGLGPLLERMPGGLMQMVGETGWQLSQGERSRLFMARALLQAPEVVVLDESFAALDPENLRQALECALARSKTLIVVAHP